MKNVQGINGGYGYPRQVTVGGGREGLRIADLKGTPLYALAQNANVYGGATLSKTEMVFFQQQAKEMGFNPERYGFEIISEDLEGADFKETEKNAKNVSEFIKKSYERQFGKKNNAVQTAQDAETRAYSNIKIAKDAFARNHKGIEFTPENLGARPNFMDPMYKDNLTKYVSDLNAWAQDVAHAYQDADSMSNEQLAAMIMQNSDENAVFNAGVTIGVGEEVMNNDNENAAILYQQGEATQELVKQDLAIDRQDLAIDKQDLAIDKQDLAIDKKDLAIDMNTNQVVHDTNNRVKDMQDDIRHIKKTTDADLAIDSETNYQVRQSRIQMNENRELNELSRNISDTLAHTERETFGTFRDATVQWIETTRDGIISSSMTYAEKVIALRELNRMVNEDRFISEDDKKNFDKDYRGIDSRPSEAKPKRDSSKDDPSWPNPPEFPSHHVPPNGSQPKTADSGDDPNSRTEPDKRDA